MSIDEKHAHLIERAAARLRDVALSPSSIPSGVASEDPDGQRLFEQRTPRSSLANGKPRPAKIGGVVLAKAGALDWDRPGSRIIEELTIAQSKLLSQSYGGNVTGRTRPGNIVMVTSALRKEGKSFISLNLAVGIARHAERKVLLIDTDSKPGSLAQIFGLSAAPGLLDFACDDSLDVADLIVETDEDNLEFLPTGGTSIAGPLARARMSAALEHIGRRYSDRLIIVDAAPCLMSSDPHRLASTVGQIVFVVAAGLTQRGDVEAAVDLVQTCPAVSLLLNKVKPWSGHSFGSYASAPA